MKRWAGRGSLAYYLAAVVCGSFFLAVSYFAYFQLQGAQTRDHGRDLLFLYFFALLFGLLPLLLGAWVLRRVTSRLGWHQGWQWLLLGTVIFVVALWGLGQLGLAFEDASTGVLLPVLLGPMFAAMYPLWVPVPPAAATAWVLFLVHRAFEERRFEAQK